MATLPVALQLSAYGSGSAFTERPPLAEAAVEDEEILPSIALRPLHERKRRGLWLAAVPGARDQPLRWLLFQLRGD